MDDLHINEASGSTCGQEITFAGLCASEGNDPDRAAIPTPAAIPLAALPTDESADAG